MHDILCAQQLLLKPVCCYDRDADWQVLRGIFLLRLLCFQNAIGSVLTVARGSFVFSCKCFSPLGLTGGAIRIALCLHHWEGGCNDCDIQSTGQASLFAFTRLFDSHAGSVGKRRQKTGKGVSCVCVAMISSQWTLQCVHTWVTWFALNMRIIPHPPTSSFSQGASTWSPPSLPWCHWDGHFRGFRALATVPHTGTHTHTSHVVSVVTCS